MDFLDENKLRRQIGYLWAMVFLLALSLLWAWVQLIETESMLLSAMQSIREVYVELGRHQVSP